MTLCLVFLLILFFYFWRFDHFGKAPYKKLFVCMYVCKTLEPCNMCPIRRRVLNLPVAPHVVHKSAEFRGVGLFVLRLVICSHWAVSSNSFLSVLLRVVM